MIKSALELALERTASIESDKSGARRKEVAEEGKKLAAKYLAGEAAVGDLAAAAKARAGKEQAVVKSGMLSVFLANLTLPVDGNFAERLASVEEGIAAVTGEKKAIAEMFSQISAFFTQYVQSRLQLEQQLAAQYEPTLRRKEQELARQLGRAVQLTPQQDPEFMAALQKNLGALASRFQGALDGVKAEMEGMVG